MSARLRGRSALVTGASGGLGRHVAIALADAGASVALTGRREAALAEVAREVRLRRVSAEAIPADLSDEDAAAELVAEAEAALGPIDLLVNNAACEIASPYERLTADEDEPGAGGRRGGAGGLARNAEGLGRRAAAPTGVRRGGAVAHPRGMAGAPVGLGQVRSRRRARRGAALRR